MAQYKVEICGVNTGKLPLLTEEEKQILFDKIKRATAMHVIRLSMEISDSS